jgi:hypothetical protein
MSTELPSNISAPPSIDPTKLSNQASSFLISSSPTNTPTTSPAISEIQPPIDTSALLLAIFGWQAEASTISGLASCAACFRRLGLWLFKPSSRPSSPDAPSPSPPSMTRLDVVAEHRDYCPWINSSSQSGGSTTNQLSPRNLTADLAGWELLLRVIHNTQQSRRDATGLTPGDEQRINSSTNNTQEASTDTASRKSDATTAYLKNGDRTARDEKDKERWAKIKRLKQVFHVKRGKGKLGDQRKDVTKGRENAKPGAERTRLVG